MAVITPLSNPIRHYAWGSHRALADLLGKPAPAAQPEAELWMGAHPTAPSTAELPAPVPLDELIRRQPTAILGEEVAGRFGGLPFLFKVLAAAEPLSLQLHPDARQAAEGFARESASELTPEDPRRNYRDSNPKPEILCALDDFHALHGFRPLSEIVDLLEQAAPSSLATEIAALRATVPSNTGALRDLFLGLLELNDRRRQALLEEACDHAERRSAIAPFAWLLRLHQRYPGDIGILSPLLLNLVHLRPGQALFTGAGVLHCYLEGIGVELMANSDNVVRGGLSGKHVDRHELSRLARWEPQSPRILEPEPVGPFEKLYPTEAEEFRLSVICLKPGDRVFSDRPRNVELLLCVDGEGELNTADANHRLRSGRCLLVPATADAYRLSGRLLLYKATVP